MLVSDGRQGEFWAGDDPSPPRRGRAPFDFTDAMHALMTDMAATCDELRHVDMSRVAVIFSQARSRRLDGIHAQIHPLRFRGGARRARLGGHTFEMPRVVVNGKEALYVVAYSLPRFLDLSFEEKIGTIIHEMMHISPGFDGDVRRFTGSRPYHTSSKRRFEALACRLARAYVSRAKRPELHAFLRQSFRELADGHGSVVGLRMRSLRPRRID